jgi:hypothetical protein
MEQIVLLAIFLLAGLINAIIRWRQQSGKAPTSEREPPPPERAPLPLPRPRLPRPPRPSPPHELPPGVRVHVPVPVPEEPVPAVRRPAVPAPRTLPQRQPVHQWLASRAAVRQTIVAMTLLGPCRALEREPGVTTPGPGRP